MKKIVGVSIGASLLLIGGMVIAPVLSLRAKNEVAELLGEYDFNDEVEIPSYTFDVGSEKVEVEGTVVFPNGKAFRKSVVKLDQYGLYKVNYSKVHNGKNLFKSSSFIVRKNLVTYKNERTKVYQNTIPSYAIDYTRTNGVYVELAKGDTITFEKEFEASSFTGQNFVRGFITPKVSEEYDMSVLVLTLTDALNPDIYLRWELNTNPNNTQWQGVSYMRTAGNGQTIGGWNTEKGEDAGYFQNGMGAKLGAIPFNNRVFTGLNAYKVVDPSDYQFRVSYDNKSLVTTANGYYVADYDDAKCYNKFWDGFPSGKCKLSVSADKYVDTFARFCITSVDGLDLTSKKSSIENNDEITVNFDTAHMPEACSNRAYRLPDATSKNGLEVHKKVYYNYKSTNPTLVYTNGEYFVPSKVGTYTIVYSTANEFNKEAIKTVEVHCGADIPEITAEVPSTFVETCNIGDFVELPKLENVSGGSGDLTVNITATLGNEVVEVKDYKFQPLKAGEWTIAYNVSDYNGVTKTYTKTLRANLTSVPAFAEAGNNPQSYLHGLSVELPVAYGYEFVNGVATKKLCDVEVIDNKGSHVYTDGTFAPSVSANGDPVTINFQINGHTVYSYNPKVIILYDDRGMLHFENYFLGDNFNLEKNNTGAVINHTSEEAHWNFYSKLIAENFELVLNNDPNGKTDFSEMVITIKDMKDPNIAASVKFTRDGDSQKITVNNKTFDFAFDFTKATVPLTVGFRDGQFVVNNVFYTVTKADNGDAFNGFTSDFVYVDVKTKGTSNTSYVVSSLNGNNFVGFDDLGEPEFHICGTYAGKYDVGTVYRIHRTVFNDVISPYCKGSFSVKDKNNEYAVATDGTVLKDADPTRDYDLVLTEYGAYVFTYKFTDESPFSEYPNEKDYVYKVTCADFVPPTIEATTSWTKEAKVGDVIVMPNIKVTDNYSTEDNISVYRSIVTPYGFETLLEEGENAIRVSYPGKYVFKVVAMDEFGNTSMAQFECIVK